MVKWIPASCSEAVLSVQYGIAEGFFQSNELYYCLPHKDIGTELGTVVYSIEEEIDLIAKTGVPRELIGKICILPIGRVAAAYYASKSFLESHNVPLEPWPSQLDQLTEKRRLPGSISR